MRFKEIDALRGIACLFVVIFHYTCLNGRYSDIFRYGITGVDLFFLISGFVIVMTLNKTKTLSEFIISRFSRLYPSYWVCVSITAIWFSVPAYKYWANMTMFQFYLRVWNIDGSYWTMIIEMLFYMYMGALLKFNQLKNIEIISSVILLACLVYSLPAVANSRVWHFLSYRMPLINHFPLFFAGILFYQMKIDKKTATRWFLLACCFLVQLMLFDDGGRAALYLPLGVYIINLSVYFIIFILFLYDKISLIVNKVTIFLGSISFPLYLIHQMIGLDLIEKMHNIPLFTSIILSMGIVISMAYIIHVIVEKPALKFIRKSFKINNNGSNKSRSAPQIRSQA